VVEFGAVRKARVMGMRKRVVEVVCASGVLAMVVGCTSAITPAIPLDAALPAFDAALPDSALPMPDAAPTPPDATADASAPADAGASDASDASTPADALPPLDVFVPIVPPTTEGMTGPGLNSCGPGASDSCARTIPVPGGAYGAYISPTPHATLSPYRLDKYKVTVGRFRKFTAAWLGGWRPAEGAGKHLHVHGGRGLARTTGGYESGWSSAWSSLVGAPSQAALPGGTLDAATWNTSLSCAGTIGVSYASWTASAGARESWPVNCVNWVEALAFCIWDGGFLPSELEWDHASVGGTEQRGFPWGSAPVDPSRALYASSNLEPVGGRPAGDGRWGHSDLLGTLSEFVYDVRQTQPASNCTDCTHEAVNAERTIRGTNFRVSQVTVTGTASVGRSGLNFDQRGYHVGFRCARP
jgi:formylglycine-generating enzyme required for sulfatase activity